MLGRVRRTTRLDVGLALAFSGIAYLVWALVAGSSRQLVREIIHWAAHSNVAVPRLTQTVKVFFSDTGFVIDLVGLLWLAGSLVLVVLASRQVIVISWAWVCAICQAFVAALGGVLVGRAAYAPHALPPEAEQTARSGLEIVSQISLPVIVPIAVLLWVTALVWLLVERARLDRRGPSLRDGLRSNIYK